MKYLADAEDKTERTLHQLQHIEAESRESMLSAESMMQLVKTLNSSSENVSTLIDQAKTYGE